MKSRHRWVAPWILDPILVALALSTADYLRQNLAFGEALSANMGRVVPWLYPLAGAIWSITAYLLGAYVPKAVHVVSTRFTTWAITVYAVGVLVYIFNRDMPRLLYLYFATTLLLLLVGLASTYSSNYQNPRHDRVAVIGADHRMVELAKRLRSDAFVDRVVGYIIDGEMPAPGFNTFPVLGTLHQAPELIREHAINRVILASPRPPRRDLIETTLQLRFKNVAVQFAPDLWDLAFGGHDLGNEGETSLVQLNESSLSSIELRSKRLFDVAVAIPASVLCIPICALICLAIVLDSPGSPVFTQCRVGQSGRLFKMYKFRTMVRGADKIPPPESEDGQITHKMINDPRVTRFGRFLRRTSLDELPQLFNVLKSDMSLVGPRPEMPWLVGEYEGWQYQRFLVPQGMTGWWQISGRSDRIMHRHTEDDLYYIRSYSFLLDLKILAKTILVVLTGRGAY